MKIDSTMCFNNYILMGNEVELLRKRAKEIAEETRSLYPSCFNGIKSYIDYELKYIPPFDKDFDVLFNLQGITAEEARFQDKYRGFIIIDVSKYLGHEKEEWFDLVLKFLYDQGDIWKSVFLVDMTNDRIGKDMVSKILSIQYCRIEDLRVSKELAYKKFIVRRCEEHNLQCSKDVLIYMEDILGRNKGSQNAITLLIEELSDKFGDGRTIDIKTIFEHLESGDSVVKLMMSSEGYDTFLALAEKYLKKSEERSGL